MKNILKLTTIVAAYFLGGLSSDAAARTNLVQTLDIRFTAYFQGPTITNAGYVTRGIVPAQIYTHNIIRLLGNATGNDFSAAARLLIVRPLPDGNPMVIVRDGSNTVVVTQFFSHDLHGTPVSRARLNRTTGFFSGQQYSSRSFGLKDADGYPGLPGHFDVCGLTLVSFVSLLNAERQVIGFADEYVAAVAGTGDFRGDPAVLRGTISGKGRTIEVWP